MPVSKPPLLPLACSITFREKCSNSFVIEFIYATDFTILLGGPHGLLTLTFKLGNAVPKMRLNHPDKQLLMQWKEYGPPCLVVCVYSREPPGNAATQLSTDNVQLCEG